MNRVFTDEELNYIKNNYNKMSYKELTNKLNTFNAIKKTDKQVRTKAATMGLSKKIHNCNYRFFKNINTEEKAYWLGFFFADGYVIHNPLMANYEASIQLSSIDKDHLVKFNKAIAGNFDVTTHIKKPRQIKGVWTGESELAQIRIYSKAMVEDLINLGVVQNKTYRPEYPIIDDALFIPFLRGFLDGDGSIEAKGDIKFINPNCEFLKYLINRINNLLGIHCGSIYNEEQWKSSFVIPRKSEVVYLLNMLYKDAFVFLDRKYDRYKNIVKDYKQAPYGRNAIV